MSGMTKCKCDKSNYIVIHYKHNHSAFIHPKYGWHPSDYSMIMCMKCGIVFSSKAQYVDTLKKATKGCIFEMEE